MTTAIRMPDGTVCRSGPNCKRHSIVIKSVPVTVKVEQLKSQIDALFENSASQKPVPVRLPEWWDKYAQEDYEKTVTVFKQFGLKEVAIPTFHEPAMRYGYISVNTGEEDTQLIVNTDGFYAKQGENYYCRAWMYKNGKPVAMVRFSTYPLGYTPPEGQYPYVESIICDIEVREGHTGNGYAMEAIRQVEKNILDGRLIHSGGSYTPEGRKSLGGKLPYTHDAKNKYEKILKKRKIPESSFSSMKFIHNWDELAPL